MNPIAFGMIAFGVLLFVLGLALIVKQRKATGIAVSLLGLGFAAVPLVISFYLFR